MRQWDVAAEISESAVLHKTGGANMWIVAVLSPIAPSWDGHG